MSRPTIIIGTESLFRPLKMGTNFVFGRALVFVPDHRKTREELCIRVCFSFFSTQNQVPQIIIELGCKIYHIEALSVVIRTT